jgi:hypothetical protein
MQLERKGECENRFLRDLEVEGDLALLLVHALIGQPAKEHSVGGVVGVDGYADASGNVESIAVDADRFAQGVGDAGGAGPGDEIGGLVAGQVGGDDHELVAAEAGEGIGDADGAAEIVGDVPKELVADVVAVGVVDELEAVEIDHQEGGASVVDLGLLDGGGEAILKKTLVGKAGEMVVEGVPLVGGDLLLEQDQEHADGDEKFLQVPDLISDGIVSRMIRSPGVGEEDEGPDDEADDDGDFAEASARQADVKDDGGCKVQDKEKEVRGVAKRPGGGEEPDRDPGAELDEENPPAFAEAPGPRNREGADDTKEETATGDNVIDARVMNGEPVDGEQGRDRKRVDQQIEESGLAGKDIPARGPEEDRSGYEKEVQCDDVRDETPGAGRGVRGVNDGFEEDEEQADEPEIDSLAWMPHPQKVEDAEQHGHCSEVW